jgi:hypothetical protein
VTALGASPALSAVARAAAPSPATPVGDDVGFLQFGALAELISVRLYATAAKHPGFSPRQRDWLLKARAADKQHYTLLAAPLGGDAPKAGDYRLNFPAKTLRSRTRLLALCDELEQLTIGVYISGSAHATDSGTRGLLSQLVAADTEHVASLRRIGGKPPSIGTLPAAIDLEVAGTKLDTFLSNLYPEA